MHKTSSGGDHFMNKPLSNEPFSTEPLKDKTGDDLRTEVHELADAAFHSHLISGHGDSEFSDSYQIVRQGKPTHLPLNRARTFLAKLIQRSK